MGRRVLNRREMRADYDAAERQKTDEEGELDESEETEDDEDEEEGDADAEASDEEGDDEGEEEAPKKKKAAPKPAKPKAKPRSRAKVVRQKVVWGVFSNSNQRVATYEYAKRKEADEHAARLTTDKKSTHFVQPVKEPMEEK